MNLTVDSFCSLAKLLLSDGKESLGVSHMSEYGYRVIYERLADGGYQVIVPALPGIITYGRALEEAREMAEDAITCHLQGLMKDNEEIPEDPFAAETPISEKLKIAV
jgi:antitoxin HicB